MYLHGSPKYLLLIVLLVAYVLSSVPIIHGHTYVFVNRRLVGLRSNITLTELWNPYRNSAEVEAFTYNGTIVIVKSEVNYSIPGYPGLGLGNLSLYIYNVSGYLEKIYRTSLYVYNLPILIHKDNQYFYTVAHVKDGGVAITKIDMANKNIDWSIHIKKIDDYPLSPDPHSLLYLGVEPISNNDDYLGLLLMKYPNWWGTPVLVIIKKDDGEVLKALSISPSQSDYVIYYTWRYNGVAIEYPYAYIVLPLIKDYLYIGILKIDFVNNQIIWSKRVLVDTHPYIGDKYYIFGGYIILHNNSLYVIIGDRAMNYYDGGFYILKLDKTSGRLLRGLRIKSNAYDLAPEVGTGLFVNATHIIVSTTYNILVFNYELDNVMFATFFNPSTTGIWAYDVWLPVYIDNNVYGFFHKFSNATLLYRLFSNGYMLTLKINGTTDGFTVETPSPNDIDYGDIGFSLSTSNVDMESRNDYMREEDPPPTWYAPYYVEDYTHVVISQPNTSVVSLNVTVIENNHVEVYNASSEPALCKAGNGYVLSAPLTVIYSPARITGYSIHDRELMLHLSGKANISIAAKPGTIEKIIVDGKTICGNSTECELLRDPDNVIVVDTRGSTVIIVFKYYAFGGVAETLDYKLFPYIAVSISIALIAIYVISERNSKKNSRIVWSPQQLSFADTQNQSMIL